MRGPTRWPASYWGVSAMVLAIVLIAMVLVMYRSLNPTEPRLTRATTTTSTTGVDVASRPDRR